MEKEKLGRSAIEVSRLCFGTLTLSPLQRNLPCERGAELLAYAFSNGINFIDTAELYDNYPPIKAALKQYPDTVVSTKCYAYDREGARQSFEKAAKGIGRDYIDLFLLHEQESAQTLKGHYEAIEYFLSQKQKGYIRAVGISTHYIAAAQAVLRYPELDVVHPLINISGLGIADGTRDDMEKAIKALHGQGYGIYTMKALGGGHLIERRREALDYIMGLPYVDSIALGMQSEDEIDYNISVLEGKPVDEALEARLGKVKRRMIVEAECVACGQCVQRCRSGAMRIADGRACPDENICVGCGYCGTVCPQFAIKII